MPVLSSHLIVTAIWALLLVNAMLVSLHLLILAKFLPAVQFVSVHAIGEVSHILLILPVVRAFG